MDYMNYVQPELLILIPVLYSIGANIKMSKKIADNFIPFILTLIGIVLAMLYICATQGITLIGIFTAIVQGVLVAAVAVYTHQLIKQSSEYRLQGGK